MKKVVIAGAGPAGLLLAHYLLARENYQVEIYERRPDPLQVESSSQRTFPLSLQLRGLQAIRAVDGLEAALAEDGVWSNITLLHSKQGKARRVERKLPLLLLDRNRLTRVLLQQLLNRNSNKALTVRFNCTCTGVESKTATFVGANQEAFKVDFDYLVGADGVRSQVRDTLVASGKMRCEQSVVPDAYKSLFVRRVNHDGSAELAANQIHSWNIDPNRRVLLAPQPDGWLHGVILFPLGQDPLADMADAQTVVDYFQEKCPTLTPFMTLEEAEALRQRQVSKLVTVRCDRMHVGDHILLLGDAIHAVSPSIGQGCNASLQDVQVFNQLLDRYQDSWEQALPEFTRQRLPEVHALRDLSDYSFPRSKPMVFEFIFRLTIGKKLKRWLPRFGKPLPMELIMDSDLAYTTVLAQTQGWVNRVKQSMVGRV